MCQVRKKSKYYFLLVNMKVSVVVILVVLVSCEAVHLTKTEMKKNPSRVIENRRHPEYTEGDILPKQLGRRALNEVRFWKRKMMHEY